jgi:hypothetical protein
VPSTAVASSTVYALRALNGDRERAVLFRLTVQVATPPTNVSTTTPETPETPATPATPATPTTTAASVALTIQADVAARVASPGETAAFPIILDRRGYAGPVEFIAAGTQTGSVVGYSPNPSVGNP